MFDSKTHFMTNKIPITILTGFLGAGKTTLLNHLIHQYKDKNFAIIENEFGEVSIDSDIVVGIEDNKLFELADGCICCSSNAEFGVVINKLVNERGDLDHIIVETTGIANPASVVESLLGDSFIMQKVTIDSVICLVDSVNLDIALEASLEARKQILLADLLIVSKTDLLNGDLREDVHSRIRKINPSAGIIDAVNGDFGDEDMIGRDDFSGLKTEQSIIDFTSLSLANAAMSSHDVMSFSFTLPGSFDANKFPFWLWHFLNFNKKNIYRIKGVINYHGVYTKMLLQAVGGSHIISPLEEWPRGEELTNKLVFIGKDLNRDELKESLQQLIVHD